MEIYAINLVYFLIVLPFVLISFPYISRLNKNREENHLKIIIILTSLLFIVRFILIFFGETIGIMPYLVEDVLFYSLLMIFGLFITWFYIKKIEKVTLREIGWEIKDAKKSVLFGILSYVPLMCFFPLLLFLANIQLSFILTWEKVVVAIAFGILGAFYEEMMFRGIIQNHFKEITDENKAIIYTALLFTATHIFYLPFIGFGIYYIFVFIMALILSVLRLKFDQLSCAILHGGIVFILIIFV